MNLQIDQQIIDYQHVIKLTGEVDAYTAPQLRETLIPLLEKEGAKVIVDLSGTQYMDSTGLGIFVAGLKSSKKFKSTFIIKGLTPRVQRLFEITGLSEVMGVDEKIRGGQK